MTRVIGEQFGSRGGTAERPAIVTVVTTHGWEPRLVHQARTGGLVRLLQRCSTYEQVLTAQPDAVVVGSESALATRAVVRSWKLAGIAVVGVVDPTDPTAEARLSEADALYPPDDPRLLTFLATAIARTPAHGPRIFTVTGARGAPGRTEVALALAWALGDRLGGSDLIDLDLDAPCLGLRLGIPPFDRPTTVSVGPLRLTGFPPGQGSLGESLRARILASLAGPLVIDAGPGARHLGTSMVVGTADDVGLVRLVRLLKQWTDAEPMLVVNRSSDPDLDSRLVSAATGIEPVAVIHLDSKPSGPEPIPAASTAMQLLVDEMDAGADRRSA